MPGFLRLDAALHHSGTVIPTGYTLRFSDEFDYGTPEVPVAPDADKWGAESEGASDPSYATVDGTKLILRTTGTEQADRVSSAVRTSDTPYLQSWRGTIGLTNLFQAPGYLVIRMKPSTVRGVMSELILWSSWTEFPDDSDDQHYGELDIVEARGFQPTVLDITSHAWIHPGFVSTIPPATNDQQHEGPNNVEPGIYRIYTVWWDETFVRIYVDGILRHSRDVSGDPGFPLWSLPMALVMGCWTASDSDTWAGAQGVAYPVDTQMEVDYVRYYSSADPHDPTLIDFGDENASRYYTIPHGDELDLIASTGWAWLVWVQVTNNAGTANHAAISAGTASRFAFYVKEASAASNANTWRLFVGDGTTTRDISGSTAYGGDSLKRLVVAQYTGTSDDSTLQLLTCLPGAYPKLESQSTSVTFNDIVPAADWHIGRDGPSGAFWDDFIGPAYKVDRAVTRREIQRIAGGEAVADVLGADLAGAWDFSSPDATVADDVAANDATRQGTWT